MSGLMMHYIRPQSCLLPSLLWARFMETFCGRSNSRTPMCSTSLKNCLTGLDTLLAIRWCTRTCCSFGTVIMCLLVHCGELLCGYAMTVFRQGTSDASKLFFWWPHLWVEVEQYVAFCPVCRAKDIPGKPAGHLLPLPIPKRPW